MLIAAWLNGSPVAGMPVDDRGFAYGDGHFTTLPVRGGEPVLLDYHWRRLLLSSQSLNIPVAGMDRWRQDFARFVAAHPDGIAKIIITRGAGGRGYLPDVQQLPNCYFLLWTEVPHASGNQAGIESGILQGRLGLNPLTAGHKHLNRLEQVLLRQELALTPWPEAVVCDLEGRVIEGVFSNLFAVQAGRLLTPALSAAGVRGVMRSFLMDSAGDLQHTVLETGLQTDDLDQADELFFCNSVFGIWPVIRFNGRIMPPNPVTQRLQQHLKNARITA